VPPPEERRPGRCPLKGAVTDAYTISVTQGGKKVKTLHPGSYLLTVNDQSTIHDFHLFGPGVNKKTAVAFHGTVTWTVKLVRGTYRYQCDPHSHFMHGSFTVA
jgi:plastocyanin